MLQQVQVELLVRNNNNNIADSVKWRVQSALVMLLFSAPTPSAYMQCWSDRYISYNELRHRWMLSAPPLSPVLIFRVKFERGKGRRLLIQRVELGVGAERSVTQPPALLE